MKEDNLIKLKNAGLNIIPCYLKSKKPTLEWTKFQTSRFTGDIPLDGNAAVICGRIPGCTPIVVIDIDSPELINIIFDDFEKIKTQTLVVQTGKGGYHVYVRPKDDNSTAGKRLTNHKGQHMDIQGDRTYVMAPGSIHPNGNEYKIISSTTDIYQINIDGFLNALKQYGFNTEGSGLKPIHEISKGVGSGDRNNSAFKYACHLLTKVGIVPDQAWSSMLVWNKLNKPPMDENEIKAVFESALKRCGVQFETKKEEEVPKSEEGWIDYLVEHIGNNYNMDELNNKFILDVSSGIMQCGIKKYPATFIDKIREALEHYSLNPKIELSMEPNIRLGDVTPKIGDRIICFDANVIAVEDRESWTKCVDIFCPDCDNGFSVYANERHDIYLPKCKECKFPPRMKMVESSIEADYVQTIYVSESIDEAKHSTPVTFKARIYGDVVGEAFVGQRKRLIGQLTSTPKKGSKFNEIILECISITGLDDSEATIPTEKEIEEWKEKAEKPEFFDEIAEEALGTVLYNDDAKKACLLATISAPATKKKINNIHVLLVGDPGTSKSTLMEETQAITFKNIFTGGRGNSAAGLTGGMDRPSPNMPMVFLPGALTIANKGTAFIDEIDKMREHDREALLMAMAKGYTPINKVGVHGILPTNTTIIAAANPKGGRWKEGKSIIDQTNLSEPLISRFDSIWLIRDIVDEYKDKNVSKHIMNQMNVSEEKIVDTQKIMNFINYIRTLNPELTQEAKTKVTEYYVRLRRLSGHGDKIPIDARKTESIAKMAMAHARLKMKKQTDVEDVEIGYKLFEESLKSFGVEISEKANNNYDKVFKTDDELNKEDTVYLCIDSIKDENGNFSESEFIDSLATTKYFDSESAKREFYKWLEKLSRLSRNPDGTFRSG